MLPMDDARINTARPDTQPAVSDQAVVASYRSYPKSGAAVHRLPEGGLPINRISIIGRHLETHEGVQGFYRPADAAPDGAGAGAWCGGLMMGTIAHRD